MTEITDTISQVLAQILGHPLVGMSLRLAGVYLVVLWLAAAWWTWRDARSRTRDPIVPYLAAAGVVLVSPLLFPLAVAVYRVVRPDRTVAAAESSELQLAMLEEEATRPECRRCGAAVDEAWLRCPACGSTLAMPCSACERPVELDWTICAWCAADVPWAPPRATPAASAEPVAIPIRPGGRPLVPVMAVPEPTAGEQGVASTRRPARPRRRKD